jgi:hypothetical protein
MRINSSSIGIFINRLGPPSLAKARRDGTYLAHHRTRREAQSEILEFNFPGRLTSVIRYHAAHPLDEAGARNQLVGGLSWACD